MNEFFAEGKSHQEVCSLVIASGASLRLLVHNPSAPVTASRSSAAPAAPVPSSVSPAYENLKSTHPQPPQPQNVPDSGPSASATVTEKATIESAPTRSLIVARADVTPAAEAGATQNADSSPPQQQKGLTTRDSPYDARRDNTVLAVCPVQCSQ